MIFFQQELKVQEKQDFEYMCSNRQFLQHNKIVYYDVGNYDIDFNRVIIM